VSVRALLAVLLSRGTGLETVRKALQVIGRENRGRWALLITLALVTSGLEVLGAALVYLLLALIADPGGEIALPFVGDVRATFDVAPSELLLGLAGVMAVFFLMRAALHVLEIYTQNRIAHNFGARLAKRLTWGYLSMPYAFHLTRNSADLIRNTHQAVKQLVEQIFLPVIRVTAEVVLVLGMLGFLLAVAPGEALLAVLIVGGTAACVLRVVQPRLKRLGRLSHHMERETLATLQQSFQGIRDIKVLGRERAFASIYGEDRAQLARATYLHATARDLPRTVMELALLGFILTVFVYSIVVQGGAEGTLSMLGIFAYAGLRIQPSLQRIIGGLNDLRFATAPLDDLTRDLRMIEVLDVPRGEVEPLPFSQAIRLERVTFRYDGADRDAVHELDLTIAPGEVLGICGPTGGGKTTLTDLITGLLEPTSGRITVDGKDLPVHARRWHATLGVVPQMVFLVDDSLRRNIALGLRDQDIDEGAINEAVELAQLREFVDSLPAGLDTRVGERGVRISGGQRQRISIARALYRRPDVLVFDEGTSALDNTTESELITALERLRGSHTILLVAHRLSTVRKADRIVLMQHGEAVALGTYDGLLESSPEFRALATLS
jgi:ATP-binding cassette, subfamily B, bacterial PglK